MGTILSIYKIRYNMITIAKQSKALAIFLMLAGAVYVPVTYKRLHACSIHRT